MCLLHLLNKQLNGGRWVGRHKLVSPSQETASPSLILFLYVCVQDDVSPTRVGNSTVLFFQQPRALGHPLCVLGELDMTQAR